MSCGGQNHQWRINKGRCSICGEAADLQAKQFGMGDPLYIGKIVRTYRQGAIIPVTAVITANHLGIFEFRVCSLDSNPNQDATQACLDANLLQVSPGVTQYPIKSSYRTVRLNISLPENLTCKHCVFQWKYQTGNSWGSSNGRACLGCGRENEEFYGCSDVAIVGKNEPIPTVTTKQTTTTRTPRKQVAQATNRICGSAITFSSTFDLYNVMDQYCRDVCPNRCASDNKPGNELLYDGCLNSCDKLCSCQ